MKIRTVVILPTVVFVVGYLLSSSFVLADSSKDLADLTKAAGDIAKDADKANRQAKDLKDSEKGYYNKIEFELKDKTLNQGSTNSLAGTSGRAGVRPNGVRADGVRLGVRADGVRADGVRVDKTKVRKLKPGEKNVYQKITWDEITASSLDNDQPNLGGEGDTGSKLNELIRKEMSKDAVYQDR